MLNKCEFEISLVTELGLLEIWGGGDYSCVLINEQMYKHNKNAAF